MRIRVESYSGYRGEETPRVILMSTYKVAVKEMIDRWRGPDHRYFKIIGDDNATYIIRHDTATWVWELVFYQTAGGPFEKGSEIGES
jgi:hypothetical protein